MYKLPTVTVNCDDYVIEDEQEKEIPIREGETVTFISYIPGKTLKMLTRIMNMEAVEDDTEGVNSMHSALESLIPILSRCITRWTWTDLLDENRPVLPKPTPDVLWDLDIRELFYLAGKLSSLTNSPKGSS